MPKIVLTDTCYWLGLIDPKDQHHKASNDIASLLTNHTIAIPWPCLYETMATRLIKNRDRLLLFESMIKKPHIVLIDDSKYKDDALFDVFEHSRSKGYSFSLADGIIREIIKDINIKIDFLITFNNRDFHDVCSKRRIEIIDNK